MYFVLGRLWARHPARFPNPGSYDRQGVWWDRGARFTRLIRTPVAVSLVPYEPRSPDQSPAMPSFIDGLVPLFRDDLLAALVDAGVDNLDLYEASVLDPDARVVHTNYKAVNLLGAVAAADMRRSVATVHDGISLIDVSFDSLVIDPARALGLLMFRLAENNAGIIVHQSVRDHVLARGFDDLEFFRPENIAL